MKRTIFRVVSLALMAMMSCGVSAQSDSASHQFSLGLNFLTHGEGRGGGLPRSSDKNAVIEDKANFLMGRTRFIMNYNRPFLDAKAVVQNNAIWGMRGNTSLSLNEAWVKAKARFGLFAQVGRIALSYDDERIIGPNDFATASLSHDVLRVGYEGHGHKAHAILAYNQNSENINTGTYYVDGAQYYKTMQTLWYHYDVPKIALGASLLMMNVGLQAGKVGEKNNSPRTEYQQLIGGYLNFHPKYFILEASYYRQTGKDVEMTAMQSITVDAWMASVKATVKPTERYGLVIGYDYLSGDDYVPVIVPGTFGMVRHMSLKGFTPIYGSRKKFYGMMDYFYESAYINGFTPGLQNTFAGVYGKPTDKLSCQATYHYLAVATDLDKLDRTLGHDIELEASYSFTKDISLTMGFTYMIGTETMDRLKQGNGDKQVLWGWFSLLVNPNLFSKKW